MQWDQHAKERKTVAPGKLEPVGGALTYARLTNAQSFANSGELGPLGRGDHIAEETVIHEVEGREEELRSVDDKEIREEGFRFVDGYQGIGAVIAGLCGKRSWVGEECVGINRYESLIEGIVNARLMEVTDA